MISNRPLEENTWRRRWYDIIFGADTPKGRLFDVILLVAIILSLLSIMLETVGPISEGRENLFRNIELFFTAIFSIEYIVRLMVVRVKRRYIFSFYGLVDLISILPTFLAFLFVGPQYFAALRALRLLRVFRVLKMVRFLGEARVLTTALRDSRVKISVFLIFVFCVVIIMGTVMYIIEGGENGFTSIPRSIYWAIVTLTTVGYGDISPQTVLGQALASLLMVVGYGIIAVPTGIVTAQMTKAQQKETENNKTENTCVHCGTDYLPVDSNYCKHCGSEL